MRTGMTFLLQLRFIISLTFSSLFRTESREEAEDKFTSLKDKLPVFIEIAKEVRKRRHVFSVVEYSSISSCVSAVVICCTRYCVFRNQIIGCKGQTIILFGLVSHSSSMLVFLQFIFDDNVFLIKKLYFH